MELNDTHVKMAQPTPYRLTMQLVVPTREEHARGANPRIELTSNNAALSKSEPGLPRGFAARKDVGFADDAQRRTAGSSSLRGVCDEAIQAEAASPRIN